MSTSPTKDNTAEDSAKKLRHIAIIMDGNRRWAKSRHLPTIAGHKAGVDSLHQIVQYAVTSDIEVITVYAFSTENWKRKASEVEALMSLFISALAKRIEALKEKGVRLRFIGDSTAFSNELQTQIINATELTKHNTALTLQVAMNYGSRAEITHALKKLAEQVKAGSLRPEEITEVHISRSLYTEGLPDPELLIRTGGDYRLSNYLLWQCAYTELYISEALWPEFSPERLQEAIATYHQRQRRFGK